MNKSCPCCGYPFDETEAKYGGWISVDDELPEIREPALICTDYGKMATAYLTDKEKPYYGWTDWMRAQHGYGSVTHWMPLPSIEGLEK